MVLSNLKTVLHLNAPKQIEIKYQHQHETKRFFKDYFKQHNIKANCVDFAITRENNHPVYVNTFELKGPDSVACARIIEDISLNHNVMRIRRVHA
ncbi:hypothetical protein DS830_06220 [Bombilactobacillus bombi]|uniref:hypothetical protein n=1 Tax=Bombilactobacillus bombi TaxID=1303590 RepID=UPI000E591685|nr:hypothetical protein [Bombilactobacillus bombi]AXX65093.1 hypothetical protein DS830_06220 [Bombilactobacillus bombi]